MRLFDTHAHLLDEQFDADREELIAALPEAGIAHVMEACCDEAGIDRVVGLVARVPYFFGSAGVHPHSADEFRPETLDHIRAALTHERMQAIGEIGLDYHYDFSPREMQRTCFDAQLALAAELHRPVIIHDREAHGDTMDLLRHYRGSLSGVMHCFSASYEIAKACIDLGLYVAFGGAPSVGDRVEAAAGSAADRNRLSLYDAGAVPRQAQRSHAHGPDASKACGAAGRRTRNAFRNAL